MIARWLTLAIASSLLCAAPASAQSVAEFYKGKTITVYIGYGAGGGYDLFARTIAGTCRATSPAIRPCCR